MTGTGTLGFTASNTYVGTTTILSGTLTVNLAGGLGNATNAVFLGDTSGSNSAALLGTGTATTPQNITVQAGSSGLAFLGGNTTATSPRSAAASRSTRTSSSSASTPATPSRATSPAPAA